VGTYFHPGPAAPYGGNLLRISEAELDEACAKLIRKHERYMRELRIDDVRRSRRRTSPADARIHRPSYWDVDPGFNPYRVRRNVGAIVRAVNLSLAKHDYRPRPPIAHAVPKASGGVRVVSIFQIVDSLVSRVVYKSLMTKNRALVSARSYAYRDDLSTHDAIQYVASEFRTVERIFVAEYDFSTYFDSISHDHLRQSLVRHGFLMTQREREVIDAFLSTPLEDEATYNPAAAQRPEQVGIPQGTSISLFLANVAAWQMDRSLERIGVGFVRYADDTLVWSRDYAQITDAVNVLKAQSAEIGADLNPHKSKGIRLFTPPSEPSEISNTDTVNFVGYRFARGIVGFNDGVIVRIRSRIQHLVWSNLLQSLDQGTFNRTRVAPRFDRDYAVLLGQIRRYLYGNFSESKLRELERGAVKRIRFPGILSYFPLANDTQQMKQLDGWLADTLYQALRKRARLAKAAGILSLPLPHGLSKAELLVASSVTSSGAAVDLRIPSVARFMSVLNRAATEYGPNVVSRGTGAEVYQYSFVDAVI
jgi:RNA-directed DNA polymerase